MVERAAPRRRAVKPEAANGGGPKGQALQPGGGSRQSNLRSDNAHATAAPPVPIGQVLPFARILTAANTSLLYAVEVPQRDGVSLGTPTPMIADRMRRIEHRRSGEGGSSLVLGTLRT